MRLTHLSAKNWRNFKSVDFDVNDRLFIVGPNAAGKSNLLDLFRFLSDLASSGGGLASALEKRGGLSKVRCLFARNHAKGRLTIEIRMQDGEDAWRYELSIKGEQGGHNRPIIDREIVECNGEIILDRPDEKDKEDPELLVQTHLEQISANQSFRKVANYLSQVQYFHLVPQIIRDPSRTLPVREDPYGSDFIAQMNATPSKTIREAWLRRMQKALSAAVPGFESLNIDIDASGRPHLVAGYKNWRSNPSRQNEADFSDGTLRLIGLLWAIIKMSGRSSILLLEEPELSLNSAIVRVLPSVFAQARRSSDVQIILSTHAPEILDDEGIQSEEILVLRVGDEGTTVDLLSNMEKAVADLELGVPTSDVVGALIAPDDVTGIVGAVRLK